MKTLLLISAAVVPALPLFAGVLQGGTAAHSYIEDVDPMIGTGLKGHGHTYPGAVFPFGFVQLSPDTGTHGWDHCSGYLGSDKTIIGFTHDHLSGTGCADLGDILLQPATGAILLDPGDENKPRSGYRSAFSHADEKAVPGYYSVLLKDYGIKVELTATAHAGLHRYTFPEGTPGHVVIDLVHGVNSEPLDAQLRVVDSTTLSGYRRSHGWAKDKTLYFVAKFSMPFESYGLQSDGQIVSGTSQIRNQNVRGYVSFSAARTPLLVRIGLSPTSVEEAGKNLAAEIPDFDFNKTRAIAQQAWQRELSKISIDSTDPAARRTFYTALYHTMLAPNFYNNADRSYRGPDGKVHSADFNYYSTFSIWDQFRAWFPLTTLTEPGAVNPLIRTMLADYQQLNQHALPVWPLCGNETWCMIGYHSVSMIATAYRSGFRGFDLEKTYAAMRDTALNDRNGQAQFRTLGWLPSDKIRASVSRTLEYAYDDWCIAQIAKALGKKDDYLQFSKYAANYRNVFDPATKFMRGRNEDGTWRTPFAPNVFYRSDYTEADAWQYAWFVPQDMDGLISLMGGNEEFADKLDSLFDQDSTVVDTVPDISGMVGQYAQGDEPVHNFAYLFNYAGQPYRTQKRIRQVMAALYNSTPDGIPGNDDCGQMSAWYVLSAMGLYPANPADGNYMIGSPLFHKTTIHLDPEYYHGGAFTVLADNNSDKNIYIQSAKLNGKPLTRSWLRHEEIAAGGTLELAMGPQPNKVWGSATKDLPSSSLADALAEKK
ncbi:MAG TPA: GH92 family glycosyl hydrolase [Chthoniobacteraceae bacterium]|jgi:predicted alpha-1,2-mannosidase|nr:GH92 family glycosyl hydrolase [Chthoniobacteraceae bacterium]